MNVILNNLLSLSRRRKQVLLVVIDLFLLYFSIYCAFVFIYNDFFPLDYLQNRDFLDIYLLPLFTIPFYIKSGIYRAVLKYIGTSTIVTLFVVTTIPTFILLLFKLILTLKLFNFDGLLPIYWLVALFNTFMIRYLAHNIFYKFNKLKLPKVLIYGAGDAGIKLAENIQTGNKYNLIYFIDDDGKKYKTVVKSVEVLSPDKIKPLITDKEIDFIFLAIPSISKFKRKEILKKLSKFPVNVMELPTVENIIDGKVSIDDMKKVQVEDILGRIPVKPISSLLSKNIFNKNVLVTGAGGSIGSELCRQILKAGPINLILLDSSEYNLYMINNELISLNKKNINIVSILDSINNKVDEIFNKYNVNTIYHAAAYKHVPMVEANPFSGAYNNILGTFNLVKSAINSNVHNFILISTDKAVRPTNIMGATKRFSELILQAYDKKNNTIFSMVRFGNVLDSAGSVLPLFRKQINDGGPLTVTHKKIIRYFMSIPEAVQLVIQSGAMSKGGEVFILDMGDPVNIYEMAKKMIYLSGFKPVDEKNKIGDIEIIFTGLRPGEKLYEELLIDGDPSKTEHPRIMKAKEKSISISNINKGVELIKEACKNKDYESLIKTIKTYVEDYDPKN